MRWSPRSYPRRIPSTRSPLFPVDEHSEDQQLPSEDRLSMTKEYAENRIAILMGGRVAEELIFEDYHRRRPGHRDGDPDCAQYGLPMG